MTYTREQKEKDFWSFINCQVKAQKTMRKNFDSLDMRIGRDSYEIQIFGLFSCMHELDISYTREDWVGNDVCESYWDIVYFDYKGYRFFELISKKEGKDDEGK